MHPTTSRFLEQNVFRAHYKLRASATQTRGLSFLSYGCSFPSNPAHVSIADELLVHCEAGLE